MTKSVWLPRETYERVKDWAGEDQSIADALQEIAERATPVVREPSGEKSVSVPVDEETAKELQDKAKHEASAHEVVDSYIHDDNNE